MYNIRMNIKAKGYYCTGLLQEQPLSTVRHRCIFYNVRSLGCKIKMILLILLQAKQNMTSGVNVSYRCNKYNIYYVINGFIFF
jgi:hypothetical protein